VRPGEDCRPLQGMSFLGAMTSHGPHEVLHANPKIKRRSGAAIGATSRTRRCCSKDARNVFIPGERASAIAVNDAGQPRASGRAGKLSKIPRHDGREKKTEWTKLPLPRTRQKPRQPRGRCRSRAREGNHSEFFSTTAAAVPAAMKVCSPAAIAAAAICSHQCRRAIERVWERNALAATQTANACRMILRSSDILIHRRDSIYIQPVPTRTGRKCCAGRRESAGTETRRDRRILRPLSTARAGSGTRHGALAGTLRAVIARGRVQASRPL